MYIYKVKFKCTLEGIKIKIAKQDTSLHKQKYKLN